MTHLKPNAILRDRYQIIGLIGAGGMGAVYLAEDGRLEGRRCAIKEQVLDSVLFEVARTQFHQEASILARLDHPGLPKVSDYFSDEDGSRDYLVMDYVPGKNLEQLLKKAQRENQHLDESTVLGWIDQLCDILLYLHSRKPIVIHRDIKPANIKITPDNRLKLVDFGLAKPFDPSDPRTVTGLQGLGSLPYTPLEQYVGHLGHTDARTDLYALGATCYHLVTSQTPASAHNRFLNPKSFTPPQTLNPRLSPQLNEAILWAMQLHPDERAESVSIWHGALKNGSTSAELKAIQTKEITKTAKPHLLTPITPAIALQENAVPFGIALILLVLALILTFGG